MNCYSKFCGDGVDNLSINDPELFQMLEQEHYRQQKSLILIASASVASLEVLTATSSDIMNVTLEGYPGNRFHAGTAYADEVEILAMNRAKKIFKAQYANVQPLSGALANNCILFGLLSPGDTLLGMDLASGGHLTHGANASITGKYFNAIHYGINKDAKIDYDQVQDLAIKHKPKIIIAGASSYSRLIDYEKFRKIADNVGSLLLADISHIAGLVATGVIPSPIDHAHFTTTSTYKQLYGPRGGIILMGKDYETVFNGKHLTKLINSAVFPGTQSTPDMASIAGKAAAFKKIDSVIFQEQMRNVCYFAKTLAKLFSERRYKIISGGTDNHMILIDIWASKGITGLIAEKALEKCNIIINKNMIPNDQYSPFITSGIRLGTNTIANLPHINEVLLAQMVNLIDDVLTKTKMIDEKTFELNEDIILETRKKIEMVVSP